RKELQHASPEDWRPREGIKARWRGRTKWFSDHLGPLRRFLSSNVGRPWDLVYSEICRELRERFPVREHFLVHVYQYVEKCVVLVDGVPCHGGGLAHGTPLRNHGGRYLYICPKTGILRRVPEQRRREQK